VLLRWVVKSLSRRSSENFDFERRGFYGILCCCVGCLVLCSPRAGGGTYLLKSFSFLGIRRGE